MKKTLMLVFIVCSAMLFGNLANAVTSSAEVSDADHSPPAAEFINWGANYYRLTVTNKDGWQFVPAYTEENGDGELFGLNNAETASGQITVNPENTPEAFTLSLAGKMYKPGGTGGSLVNWSASVGTNFSPYYVVKCEEFMALGGSAKAFTAMINTTPTSSNWTCSGFSAINAEASIDVGTGGDWVPATAGEYTITAKKASDTSIESLATLAVIDVTLTRTASNICAKPDISPIPAAWGLSSSDFEKDVNITTDPVNYEYKAILDIESLSPTQTSKGSIDIVNNSKWTYSALTEAEGNLNPGGSTRTWAVIIKDSFSEKETTISVKSVFNFLQFNNKEDEAIAYVVWKYNLSGFRVGSYSSSISDYGSITGYGAASIILYGDKCFMLDTENILASNIMHEHIHSTQNIAVRVPGALDKIAYEAFVATEENYPEPPATPTGEFERGSDWGDMELPAYEQEWSTRFATGINYRSSYLQEVEDYITFFEYLIENED